MSFDKGSQSSSSQVPMYFWGGSKVYKRRFVANLHCIKTEAQFQKWRATFASAILDNVYVRLTEPLTNDVACMDLNNPNARFFTFHLFYFSFGFRFPMSRFFKKGIPFHSMESTSSQCTLNVN